MSKLTATLRRHPVIAAGFALALAVTLFLATRAVVFAVYWADPAHRDQHIEGWMTPRYVVQSWDLPPEAMLEALGPGPMPGRRTLADIAADQGVALDVLIARIEAAAEAHREGRE